MTDSTSHGRHILVSAGSKYGATAEIAERIGALLRGRGNHVTISAPDEVDDLSEYEAVVLGSAVYAGHWIAGAKHLAQRIAAAGLETWLFSSGPVGDPPKPEEEPVDVADIIAATSAHEHRVFSGKIDKSLLSFGERAILVAVRAPEGDFRDWDEIDRWADQIASALAKEVVEA